MTEREWLGAGVEVESPRRPRFGAPHFESTDGQLYRLTLQGTLAPAIPSNARAWAAWKAACASTPKLVAGEIPASALERLRLDSVIPLGVAE